MDAGHKLWESYQQVLDSFLRQATLASLRNRFPPIIVISAAVSMIPYAGTPCTSTFTTRLTSFILYPYSLNFTV